MSPRAGGQMKGAIAALALLIQAGCSDDVAKPQDSTSPYLPSSTPENVLLNLVTAYNARDLTEYESLLAEDYIFEYSGTETDAPPSHNKATEMCVSRVAFTDPRVDTLWVMMEFESAVPTRLGSDDVWRIDVTCCDFGLLGPWRYGDESVLYLNLEDPQAFYFRADSLPSGEIEFKVIRHVDIEADCGEGRAPSAPPPNTWGWMKYNVWRRAVADSLCPDIQPPNKRVERAVASGARRSRSGR